MVSISFFVNSGTNLNHEKILSNPHCPGVYMGTARTQDFKLDSLRDLLSKSKPDTNALVLMRDLAVAYDHYHPDSTYYFGRESFLLSQRLNNMRSKW